jgi:hypothetical protein
MPSSEVVGSSNATAIPSAMTERSSNALRHPNFSTSRLTGAIRPAVIHATYARDAGDRCANGIAASSCKCNDDTEDPFGCDGPECLHCIRHLLCALSRSLSWGPCIGTVGAIIEPI